ncbi:hypothetical protein ACLB1R_28600 [Escherichia coli]
MRVSLTAICRCHSPNMVIVDTKMAAAHLARWLAGIGDARWTWFEARACS